jgi:Rrf2 family protein
MRTSAKAEYACLAVLELALRHHRPEPARLAEIAQPHGIPERFLVQILLQLKGAGLVSSVRGASGGYRLAVEPQDVSVWDVVQTIDGPSTPFGADQPKSDSPGRTVLEQTWRDVQRRQEEFLQEISFARLAEQIREQSANMFYI